MYFTLFVQHTTFVCSAVVVLVVSCVLSALRRHLTAEKNNFPFLYLLDLVRR